MQVEDKSSHSSHPAPPPFTMDAVTFIVVGGGIAGVTCAETIATYSPAESILLLTESNIIKTIANLQPVARYLHRFDVEERSLTASRDGSNTRLAATIHTLVDQLQHIESRERYIITQSQRKISYRFLCLCTGGRPRLIADDNPWIIGIRDTDSVVELQRRLKTARSVVLVGNGGIATELAHELKGVTIHWVVKDNYISSTFVDPGAAQFFQQLIQRKSVAKEEDQSHKGSGVVKRLRYGELLPSSDVGSRRGAALGPDWHRNFELIGGGGGAGGRDGESVASTVPIVYYKAHVVRIDRNESVLDSGQPNALVTLSTGERIACDFVVSATGVNPRHEFTCDQEFSYSTEDDGILVDDMMMTNIPNVYAAGDACTAGWSLSEHWFQMRLWTQARQMGAMAGRSMAAAFNGERISQDFCFELFGHVTQLFGLPVVLLGRYNGQGLGTDYELLIRSTPGQEYIKFVIQRGRLRGVILIGNTDLAETCENLILNSTDLTPYGDDILNPDIDIEDYFD